MFEEFSHPDTLKRPMLKWLLLLLTVILIAAVLVSVFRYKQRNEQSVSRNSIPFEFDPNNPMIDFGEMEKTQRDVAGVVSRVDVNAHAAVIKTTLFEIPSSVSFGDPSRIATKEVELTISYIDSTIFVNGGPSNLVVGSTLRVKTVEPVYSSKTLRATEIEFSDLRQEMFDSIVGDTTRLFGTVSGIASKELTVDARIIDIEELKKIDFNESYAVPYMMKAYVIEVDPHLVESQKIKVGALVSITTTGNIYTATRAIADHVVILEQ